MMATRSSRQAEAEPTLRRAGQRETTLELSLRGREALGKRVGQYQLERVLGHGGMGTVYLASRADQQYEKRVAIKLIKSGLATENLMTRFRVERQILAKLDHPNIARMFDGGVTEAGEPYFVMEYVAGALPLDEYCDQNELDVRQRLDVFRQVCEAAQYAHRFLVVHRDIKPGNILVSRHGLVKLMDFGIAKDLMAGAKADQAVDAGYGRSMTPRYASPEQMSGGAIGTASDIYSLGVILYELLTGCGPYRADDHDLDELRRQVCEAEPVGIRRRLSPRLEPGLTEVQRQQMLRVRGWKSLRAMEGALEGDLEWIVRKAMAKDPQQRYASVEQLSADVQRHLTGLPVLAAPDHFAYKLKKQLGRHRVAATVAAILLVAIVGFGLSMAVLAGTLTRERDRMAQERERAEQVAQFMGRMFEVSYPNEARGNRAMARDVLRQAAREAGPRFAQQPRVLATVWWTLGEAYRNLAIPSEAIPLLERALALQLDQAGATSLEVAEVSVSLGQARAAQGEWAQAERHLRQALSIRAASLGEDADATIQARVELARVLRGTGQEREAERLLRQALELLRKKGNDIDLAAAQGELSGLLASRGVLREAEDLARESLALRRKLYGEEHISVAASLELLGEILLQQDREFMAGPHLKQSLALRRRLLGQDHELTARVMEKLARAEEATGGAEEAGRLLEEALAMERRMWSEGHKELLGVLEQYAGYLSRHGRVSDAEPLFAEAAALAARHYPHDTALMERLAKKRAAAVTAGGAGR